MCLKGGEASEPREPRAKLRGKLIAATPYNFDCLVKVLGSYCPSSPLSDNHWHEKFPTR